MRRIPRSWRANGPLHPVCSSVRQQVSQSPCRFALASCTPPQATAAFSTTLSRTFLLPGKQNKKAHQQFVRRWQKRILGDSEPIGAHVDPYDPTSPVRIAPEEQGEYEEVLDEHRSDFPRFPRYSPADEGSELLRIGDEQWVKQKHEEDLAKEYEKLTRRTYTPLTTEMANEIEELTGKWYTLKDENLMMAQTVYNVTRRPYTDYNFGMHRKITMPHELRSRFAQAVAEVYALKHAGLDMDVSKLANRGLYNPPPWVKDIKLSKTESGELTLAFPKDKSVEQFLQVMQTAPEWAPTPVAEEEVLGEEAADLLDPVEPQEQVPVMEPSTPVFKRVALVKQDADKKPFDFMSNRPVPREPNPIEIVREEAAVEIEEPRSHTKTPAPSPLAHLTSAVEASRSAISELSCTIEAFRSVISELSRSLSEHRASHLANDIPALPTAARKKKLAASAPRVEEANWRHVPITDLTVKFALFKRLLQLTGIRISDPQLTSTTTLGDLYSYLCATAKPQPTSLYSAIYVEGLKARERAKRQSGPKATVSRRANLGDLINLGNVELRRVKPTETERRTKTGLEKVVRYALWERRLDDIKPRAAVRQGKNRKQVELVKPMSSKVEIFLAKKTREWKEREEQDMGGNVQ